MSSIRLCVYIPDLADGGAQRQCVFVVNELQHRLDVDVTLVRYREGVHDDLLDTSAIKERFLKATSNYDPRAVQELVDIIQSSNCNILMSWLHASDILSYFVSRRVPDLQWLLTERNSQYPRGLRFSVRKRLGRSADSIVSNSSAGDRYWSNAYPIFGRHVISNILPAELSRTPDRSPGRRDSVLFIGRLEHQKDPVRVARALALVANRQASARCCIVGDGSLRNQVAQVAAAGGGRVQLLGFRNDVPELLRKAMALVSLSRYEGQPNVLIEAVAANVPVVASAIPEHLELLGPDYPYLVDEYESPDRVAQIVELASCSRSASQALKYARQRLEGMAPKVVGDAYYDVMKRMIAGA